tara:strand:+ start:130 stop:399 length:270 start_codon:yes stop_codon:yes gene_type:complete
VNVFTPGIEIVTVSVPEVAVEEVHPPDAEHEVAFEDDQVMVVVSLTSTDVEPAFILTEAGGIAGSELPPPPPPPQAAIKEIMIRERLNL